MIKFEFGQVGIFKAMVAHLGNSVNDNHSKEENIEKHDDPVLTLPKLQVLPVYIFLSMGCASQTSFQEGEYPAGRQSN